MIHLNQEKFSWVAENQTTVGMRLTKRLDEARADGNWDLYEDLLDEITMVYSTMSILLSERTPQKTGENFCDPCCKNRNRR